MRSVKLGIVGVGNIGCEHARLVQTDRVPMMNVVALCGRTIPEEFDVPVFDEFREFLQSGIDAVLIATPTMHHVEAAKEALAAGLHVLVEKPVAMSVAQAREVAALVSEGTQCAVMLNQRFHPAYAEIKRLLEQGTIGHLVRYHWTMTHWYRPDVYYQTSAWRGTWPGEGGGLLINQCIHNLDVLQWWLGLPARVRSHVAFGKYHNIEVEDEVSVYFEHDNGMTGTLIASSGEAPGYNSLDIVGDQGMIRFDGDAVHLWRAEGPVSVHRATTRDMFATPDFEKERVNLSDMGQQHVQVLNNFADAILNGVPLLTAFTEGIGSLQLANGILYSAWQDATIALPLAENDFEAMLQARIQRSALRNPAKIDVHIDMDNSFR